PVVIITGPRSASWTMTMRAPTSFANRTAYVRPAREQSEKSTGTRMVRISRCRARARETLEVFISSFHRCFAQVVVRKNPRRYLARPKANSHDDGGMCRAVASKLREKWRALSAQLLANRPSLPARRRSNASSGTAHRLLATFLEWVSLK